MTLEWMMKQKNKESHSLDTVRNAATLRGSPTRFATNLAFPGLLGCNWACFGGWGDKSLIRQWYILSLFGKRAINMSQVPRRIDDIPDQCFELFHLLTKNERHKAVSWCQFLDVHPFVHIGGIIIRGMKECVGPRNNSGKSEEAVGWRRCQQAKKNSYQGTLLPFYDPITPSPGRRKPRLKDAGWRL